MGRHLEIEEDIKPEIGLCQINVTPSNIHNTGYFKQNFIEIGSVFLRD